MSGWLWEAEPEEEDQSDADSDGDGFLLARSPAMQPRKQSPQRGGFVGGRPVGEGYDDGPASVGSPRRRPQRLNRNPELDASSDDSDIEGGGACALSGACQPMNGGIQQVATHVVLRVKHAAALSVHECEARGFLEPGRHGMSHFLDCSPVAVTTATICVIHSDEEAPFEARRKRCIADRKQLSEVNGQREMRWEPEPGEVRVKLRPGESCIRAALVVGTEIIGLTPRIELGGALSRFFDTHNLYRPIARDGVGEPLGCLRLALELWPTGAIVLNPTQTTAAGLDGWLSSKVQPEEADRASCGFCDGVGRKQCLGCFGHGVLVCTACDGTPNLPCTQCKGTGSLESSVQVLGQRGRAATSITGKRCTTCWGSSMTCTKCFGMGGLRCAGCSGAGWIPCVNCIRKTDAAWF
jgi:hypothetical protein